MRKALSLALTLLISIQLIPAAFGADSVAAQIATTPAGARIELQLKNKKKLRGAMGPMSDSGFTLVEPNKTERRVAFDEVASFREISAKSHTKRNVLIGVAIGVAALGITAGLIARCAPFGCGSHPL
jgi:anti-sigma factor RsiW